jgi:glycosyltransferase involved in cell wall biosynthesis
MKIGITTFGTDAGKSGISQYLFNILDQFSQLEIEHEFEIMVVESEKHLYDKYLEKDNFSAMVFPDKLSSPVRSIIWHLLSLPKFSKERAYDVVFLPAANRRLPYNMPCPTVGTVHDLASMQFKNKYDALRGFYVRHVLPILIRKLDTVLTVSHYSKDVIHEYTQVAMENIFVTHLAMDKDVFNTNSKHNALQRLQKNYDISGPFLLYIARLEHPAKNHYRLIEAFDHLKKKYNIPHQLVFTGALRERGEEILERLNSSEYTTSIKYFDFVAYDDLADFYRAADIFVFPSLYEGFGLPILEAMACGTPVICSNQASIPEVAGEAGLIFDPFSTRDISDKLHQMLMDSDQKEEYRDRGLKHVINFDWRKTALQTYHELITQVDVSTENNVNHSMQY